ncbi:MAG: MFS transporter [Lactococcus sp.]
MSEKVSSRFKQDSRYAWLVLAVTYFASVVAPLQQFKIPPVASWLIPYFNMDPVTFGWLMGSMSLIGVILAFPTIFIVKRIGLKGTVLLSLCCLIVGSVMELLAGEMLTLFFLGRIIEGAGIGLVGVAAPSSITVWFSEKKRGLPIAIWCTWFPLGTILMFGLAPQIAATFGWQAVWYFCLAATALAFVLFALVFKLPEAQSEEEVMVKASPMECFRTLKNKNIWLLGIVFFCFNYFAIGVLNSFYNQYLEGIWGMDPTMAAPILSVATALALIVMPIIGMLNDKTNRRKFFVVSGFIVLIIGNLFAWTGVGNYAVLWAFIILAGVGTSMVASSARAIAPEVMPPTALGATMGMTVLQFWQNLSATVGPPLFGAVLVATNWGFAGYATLMPVLAIGLIATLLIKAK